MTLYNITGRINVVAFIKCTNLAYSVLNFQTFDADPGRVRVSVRVRPRNGEELISDADFADLVELQPEVSTLISSSLFQVCVRSLDSCFFFSFCVHR